MLRACRIGRSEVSFRAVYLRSIYAGYLPVDEEERYKYKVVDHDIQRSDNYVAVPAYLAHRCT